MIQALGTLDELKRSAPERPASWPTVVGVGFGCGPAAGLVRAGLAGRALLVDPPALLTSVQRLHEASLVDVPAVRAQQAAALFESEPASVDPGSGAYPAVAYKMVAIQISGDLAVQTAYARAWEAAEQGRLPYDAQLPLASQGREQVDWFSVWSDPGADVALLLPTERDAMFCELKALAPSRPLCQTQLEPYEWLVDPARLAVLIGAWLTGPTQLRGNHEIDPGDCCGQFQRG